MTPMVDTTTSDQSNTPTSPRSGEVGVVVIGRNEGERLERCLRSIASHAGREVYVDSGSTDASVALARRTGAAVVELDSSQSFSAARARNAGFAELIRREPAVQFVQFVDGDCELVPGWFERAAEELQSRPELAVVCGLLKERDPEASIYNRLCDLEWNGPAGEVQACGGVAMFRVSAFREVGGFDSTIPAGEEPELCSRLRQKGWKIVRIRENMGLHDAAMSRFGHWWARSVRGGYGALDVAHRFEQHRQGHFREQVRRVRTWTLGWSALLIMVGLISGVMFGWRTGTVAAACVVLVIPAQWLRLSRRMLRREASWKTAISYGFFTWLSQWAGIVGQVRYVHDTRRNRTARLMEHKAVPEGRMGSRNE